MARKKIEVIPTRHVVKPEEQGVTQVQGRRSINAAALAATESAAPIEVVGKGSKVTVMIPKDFSLTLVNHTQVHYKVGVDEMPLEHAQHWYSKAMGVEIYDPSKPRE